MSDIERETENPLRLQAIAVLKKQRDFRSHLLVYLLMNAAFVTIWATTTPDIFFWPMLPLALLGHRLGHERLGCLPRRPLRGEDRTGDGASAAHAVGSGCRLTPHQVSLARRRSHEAGSA